MRYSPLPNYPRLIDIYSRDTTKPSQQHPVIHHYSPRLRNNCSVPAANDDRSRTDLPRRAHGNPWYLENLQIHASGKEDGGQGGGQTLLHRDFCRIRSNVPAASRLHGQGGPATGGGPGTRRRQMHRSRWLGFRRATEAETPSRSPATLLNSPVYTSIPLSFVLHRVPRVCLSSSVAYRRSATAPTR